MSHETSTSSVPRRQLGRLLAQLREEALISMDAAAAELDCSRQKVWRIEKGLTSVRLPDLRAMCDLYRVPDELRSVVTGLALETKNKGWWHTYGDCVPEWFSLYANLESSATTIRRFDPQLIPGLLQSAHYITAHYRRNRPDLGIAERERAVAARSERQRLLTRRLPAAPTLRVVLGEEALRRPVLDPAGMVTQLRHLLTLARQLPHLRLRVLPRAAWPPLVTEAGTFVILDFQPTRGRNWVEPSTVYVEGLTGALYLDRQTEVAAYERVWAGLEAAALDQEESMQLIESIMEEHRDH
ncbi:helix-turn-helix transcriptional regulator [Micromonospora sp. CPCC 206060]|uniref:helix-turn-helix domain-containing protein n=1 Tax=Micromonospora sp. CPCC 206060 TaxID=3122406 RepID=UPI002FF1B670